MLAASLTLSLLAFAATLDAPSMALSPSSPSLAQDEGEPAPPPPPDTLGDAPPAAEDSVADDSVGEDMGAPPPSPPPAPGVTPPAGARVVEPEADAKGPRARMKERRRQRQAEADGLDPLLTTAAQIGAGTLTCGLCALGACGVSTIGGFTLATLGVAAIPFVGILASGALDAFLCGTVGATVGGVEAFTGNLFGQEEGSLLWPVLAGAGVGVGASAVFTGVSLTVAALNLSTPPPTRAPGETSDLNQLLAATNPVALVLNLVALGVCVAGCAAIPIVPAIVYSMTAEPKGTTTAALQPPVMPSPNPARTAMAY